MSDLPNPINRYEKYLNAIATGNSDDLPTPITREEVFLDYIARNGGGGGGGDVTGVKGNAESNYRKGNVNITPANIGLGNVDNTSDLNKPVSTAQQTALDGKVDKVVGKGLSENDYTDADKAIVGGVTTALAGKVSTTSVGSANGVAELDANGKVPSSQLPSYVDDTVEGYLNSVDGKFYADSSYTTEITGETGKIYVTLDTNKTYRWSGSGFVEISESLALGETSSTAYAGNKGKANADAIAAMKNGTNIDSFADVESAINDVNDFAKSMIAPSTLLTSSDDLNSILTAGVYRTEGTSVPAHAIGNNHIIWVIKQGATNYTRYLQVMYSFNSKEMYFRQTTDAGSTWSNWTLISSEDTGWMQIETTGVTGNARVEIYYRKIGNVVSVKGILRDSQDSDWTTKATLPLGFRPYLYSFYRCILYDSNTSFRNLYISTNGEVKVRGSADVEFEESFLIG